MSNDPSAFFCAVLAIRARLGIVFVVFVVLVCGRLRLVGGGL